jgi:ATP-binding cassette, subfamily C, bacterial CydCD
VSRHLAPGYQAPAAPHQVPGYQAPAAPHQVPGCQVPLRSLARPVRGRLALATLLGAGSAAAGIGLIATSAWLISRASQRPPESAIALAVAAVQLFALSRGLLRYGERLVGHDAALRVLAGVRVDSYERLERLAPAGVTAYRRGDLLARFVGDVDSLQDLLLRVVGPFAVALVVGVGTVALVTAMLPLAGLILLVALLVAGVAVPWLTGALARRGEVRQAPARGELSAAVVDLLEGAPELAVNGALDDQLAKIEAADAELTQIARAGARTAGVGQGLATLCCGLAMWGALVAGVAAVAAGRMDGVLLAGLALIPLVCFELVGGLPAATQSLQRVRRAAARVQEVLDAPAPVTEPAQPMPLVPAPHHIAACDVSARYPGAPRAALRGADLDLRPGHRVALVGPSGAGKTTLANVLVRFLEHRGDVALDGTEIAALDGDDCRTVVGLVAQDAHIFDTTLEENLRLARRDATAEQVADALRRARLDDWVATLPDGLNTPVGAHGAKLSGGQRRRLAIARALLRDFPVLILDEPAEHLDRPTADAILADVLDATRGRTALLITHRTDALGDLDDVLELAP